MIMRLLVWLLILSSISHTAFAGRIEIDSIQVVPAETQVRKYPVITASVKANKNLARGETREITVIASVVRPDHVMKSWTWKNVSMRAGDIKSFTIPKEYEIKLVGTYKVDFNIYSKDMRPLHKLSTVFVAVDQSLQPPQATTPGSESVRTEAIPTQKSGRSAEYQHVGFGIYANTLNGSGGATMLLWPFRYVGFQGSYTTGSFTIVEGRLLARLPLSSGINPYLGVGYLNVNTERSVEVVNIKEKFQDSGVSGVIGVEIPFSKGLSGYAEVCGASIDLKKEVASGSTTGTASVKYAPVSIGIGIVYFLF